MGLLSDDETRLTFDFNVMMIGMAAELRVRDEANGPKGMSTTRHEALATTRRARAYADSLASGVIN